MIYGNQKKIVENGIEFGVFFPYIGPHSGGSPAGLEITVCNLEGTQVATEGNSYTVNQWTPARYGANDAFYYKGRNGNISFTNDEGGDPAPGIEKFGYIANQSYTLFTIDVPQFREDLGEISAGTHMICKDEPFFVAVDYNSSIAEIHGGKPCYSAGETCNLVYVSTNNSYEFRGGHLIDQTTGLVLPEVLTYSNTIEFNVDKEVILSCSYLPIDQVSYCLL